MDWREDLQLETLCAQAKQSVAEIGTFGHMPTPNRIALARELLEGTGRVVARDVEAPEIATSWFAGGWAACRATMLADDGESNG